MKKKIISWAIMLSILMANINFNVVIAESVEIENWAQSYYDFIVRDKQNADAYLQNDWEQVVKYELIYLDEDSIPELWIDYGIWAAGCRLVTYNNDKLFDELLGKSLLIYSEYKNIFYLNYGKMGVYSDTVYSIGDNSLKCIAEGVMQEKVDNQSVIGYDYTWNDIMVTEEEYKGKLNSYVDPSVAKYAISEEKNWYSYEEIVNKLQNETISNNSSEQQLEPTAEVEGISLSTAMSITGLPYIAGNTYNTPYYMTDGSIYRNAVEQQGILGSLCMDIDGDSTQELLVISYVQSDILSDTNSVRLTMYAENETGWQVMDAVELLYSQYDEMYDITSMNGSGTPLSDGCLFIRRYDGKYQIYYEYAYRGDPLATGAGWRMMGFLYEDQKFKVVDETIDLYYEGSGDENDVLFSLDKDAALTKEYTDIVSIINTYRELGFSLTDKLGYGNLTVDQDEYCYPLVRFERSFAMENSTEIWDKLSKNGVSDDFWIKVMDYTQNVEAEKIIETPLAEETVDSDFEYVIPDSDSRYLTEADVENLSLQQINYAKNEIYARRGRKFNSPELQNYFNSKYWYYGTIEPSEFNESVFNEYERANAAFLANIEFSIDPNGYQLDQK